jgi:chorismate synthase
MNSFGRLFRVHIFGESHGECVGVTVDGCPAGLPLSPDDFLADIERRKGGVQKGTTPRKEDDIPQIKTGVFNGHTTGAPITILFENKNTRSGDYEKQRAVPRPGHADFTAHVKYGGFEDYRGGGHFSGRLTVCMVAAGVIAKKLLGDISIQGTILEIGGETDTEKGLEKAIAAKDSVGWANISLTPQNHCWPIWRLPSLR